MYFDQHLHSHHSADGRDSIEQMADGARSAGCSGITITDHCNFKFEKEKELYTPLKNCYDEFLSLREKYDKDFFLGFGVEIGQGGEKVKEANEAAAWFPYDVVLGSVHSVLGKSDYCTWKGICPDPVKEMEVYLSQELNIIEKTDFDILTHLTYPWRYFEKSSDFPKAEEFTDITNEIFKALIKKGRALEINISGLCRTPNFNIMPTLPMVKRYRELGGELVTLGTDSHVNEQCGHHMKEGSDFLKEAGFKYLAHYRERKPRMISL